MKVGRRSGRFASRYIYQSESNNISMRQLLNGVPLRSPRPVPASLNIIIPAPLSSTAVDVLSVAAALTPADTSALKGKFVRRQQYPARSSRLMCDAPIALPLSSSLAVRCRCCDLTVSVRTSLAAPSLPEHALPRPFAYCFRCSSTLACSFVQQIHIQRAHLL